MVWFVIVALTFTCFVTLSPFTTPMLRWGWRLDLAIRSGGVLLLSFFNDLVHAAGLRVERHLVELLLEPVGFVVIVPGAQVAPGVSDVPGVRERHGRVVVAEA